MFRLFVAIDLPEPVCASLAALGGGVPGAKWVGAKQIHLTLRFIGEVDGAMSRDIAGELTGVSAPAFAVEVAGVGYWGDKRRAKVLWAGTRPCPPLMRLQGKIEAALVRIGVEPERRKYQPHITLARLNLPSRHRTADWLGRNGGLALPPFRVTEFVLYSSFLSASGALHRPEAIFPLNAREAGDAAPIQQRG